MNEEEEEFMVYDDKGYEVSRADRIGGWVVCGVIVFLVVWAVLGA